MNYLVSCFKRLLRSPAFYAAVIGTAAICMFSPLFNPTSSELENILFVYFKCTKDDFLGSTSFCSYQVFYDGMGGWISMFSPVIASIAAAAIKSDEVTSGMNKFFIHRVGKIKYNISSCLFYLLSGGITMAFGYGLFGIAVYVMFPHISAYPAESADFFIEYLFQQGSIMETLYGFGGEAALIIAYLGVIFFYGAVRSAVPMAISVFTNNKYIVICTPFFLKYTVNLLSSLFYSWARTDPAGFNEPLSNIGNIINPEALPTALFFNDNMAQILLLNTALIIAAALFFCICGKGERNV